MPHAERHRIRLPHRHRHLHRKCAMIILIINIIRHRRSLRPPARCEPLAFLPTAILITPQRLTCRRYGRPCITTLPPLPFYEHTPGDTCSYASLPIRWSPVRHDATITEQIHPAVVESHNIVIHNANIAQLRDSGAYGEVRLSARRFPTPADTAFVCDNSSSVQMNIELHLTAHQRVCKDCQSCSRRLRQRWCLGGISLTLFGLNARHAGGGPPTENTHCRSAQGQC